MTAPRPAARRKKLRYTVKKGGATMELYYYTDFACPFCYVAYRRAAAFAEKTSAAMTPVFIEIHPEVPPQGCDRRLLLSDEQNREMTEFLSRLGAPYGIRPSLGDRLVNSEKALILRAWITLHRPELTAAYDAILYDAHSVRHLDIGRDSILQELLGTLELTDPIQNMLRDSQARRIHECNRFQARQEHIRAVPSFRIGSQLLPGLQPEEKLLAAYEAEKAADETSGSPQI